MLKKYWQQCSQALSAAALLPCRAAVPAGAGAAPEKDRDTAEANPGFLEGIPYVLSAAAVFPTAGGIRNQPYVPAATAPSGMSEVA